MSLVETAGAGSQQEPLWWAGCGGPNGPGTLQGAQGLVMHSQPVPAPILPWLSGRLQGAQGALDPGSPASSPAGSAVKLDGSGHLPLPGRAVPSCRKEERASHGGTCPGLRGTLVGTWCSVCRLPMLWPAEGQTCGKDGPALASLAAERVLVLPGSW